jgi:XTP/dITP diphosphohydrolase
MRIVLATSNAGKLAELEQLLAGMAVELIPQSALGFESPAETGATFLDNALIKARHAARVTGLPAIADDSGIEVDALGGAPGVRSARFAGEDASDAENLSALITAMRGVPPLSRAARYQCVLVFVREAEDAQPLVARGTWEGRLTSAPRGTGGFGYDPLFEIAELGLTAAELDSKTKNALSHRGVALTRLRTALESVLEARA